MAATFESRSGAVASTHDDGSTRRAKRLLPRFGLRSLLILLIVFSLASGWVGRNLYRMRREEAALEAMLQAGATLVQGSGADRTVHPKTPAPFVAPTATSTPDWIAGALLGTSPTPVAEVFLQGEDPNDSKVAAAVQALSVFPDVKFVELRGPAFDDRTIGPLSTLRELETLRLERTSLTGEGLSKLASRAPLRQIFVYDDEPDCDLAAGVGEFDELRSVILRGLPVAQDDFARICMLSNLEELELTNVQPRGGDLPFDLPYEMEFLHGLGEHDVALDLSEVAKLSNLSELRLANVDDAKLKQLGRLPNLRNLDVDGSVTLEAAKAFASENPRCLIGYRLWRGNGVILRAGQSMPGQPGRNLDGSYGGQEAPGL